MKARERVECRGLPRRSVRAAARGHLVSKGRAGEATACLRESWAPSASYSTHVQSSSILWRDSVDR